MKKYEKPTLEVVQLRLQENIAANTTIYNLALSTGSPDTEQLDLGSDS